MRTTTLALTLALALAACNEGERPDAIPTTLAVDAGAMAPTEDAGTTAADATAPDELLIPIAVWVDDLIEHRTNESAPPDTVEDKRIRESEEPTLFDKYFE